MRAVIYLVALACLVAVTLVSCASTDADATPVSALNGYESWVKVNDAPITGDATGTLGRAVHEGATGFRDVFVNSVGESAMGSGAYPVGTIFVKNSHSADGDQMGELESVTVMIKQDAGYDPENGDWEYINMSSDLGVRGQGAINGCISCHTAAANRDYVFLGY